MSDENKGPTAYANWRAESNGEECLRGYEINFYSDAYVTGTIRDGHGPYQFINLVPTFDSQPHEIRPVIMLRAWDYIVFKVPASFETDVSSYHGGNMSDELTALLSLDMGIRLKPSTPTRYFNSPDEKYGDPRIENPSDTPVFVSPRGARQLPHSKEGKLIAGRLSFYPLLTPEQAVSLTRAARSYQDAIWIADSDPNLAWLLLVSALEAGADHWSQSQIIDSLSAFREVKTELARKVQEVCPDLEKYLADELLPITNSTKKFLSFIKNFLPVDPPPKRPHLSYCFNWGERDVMKAVELIYGYRSKALHSGIPFPPPMCERPFKHGADVESSEIPLGEGTAAKGGVWEKKDTPMLLHTFEYITKKVLQGWWESMKPPIENNEPIKQAS